MIGRHAVGGRIDPPYFPTKTEPHFVGRAIEIPAKANGNRVITDAFTMSGDLEFYAISIRSSSQDATDYWNLSVGGRTIAKTIFCKSYEEGLYFQVAHPVKPDHEILFEYHTSNGTGKTVELLFHFLTDPGLDLILTGETNLGVYPDPPPELPETEQPPGSPPGGAFQLPVAWEPFSSVAEAVKWTSALGISANFAGKVSAANYVTEALAMLLNTCGGFAEMIQKHKLTISIQNAKGANGYFNPGTGEVVISNRYDFGNAEVITQAEYDAGQKSSPHKLRTIIHELGHWLHYHNVGAKTFYQYSSLDPDNYGAKTILSNAEAAYIANNLSNYATKWFPIELMPEAFTAKITGIPIDAKIWEWYQQYGGFECEGW